MAATNNILLGYGGGAEIDGNHVLISGGSLTKALTIPFITPYDVPPSKDQRGRVKLGDGTFVCSGSINFDMTEDSVENLIHSDFIKRNNEFSIVINDGYVSYDMDNCKFDNFSIAASANNLVTGSISFQSVNDFEASSDTSDAEYIFDDETYPLVKYWHTGKTGVEAFTITISQPLTPVYLNVGDSYTRDGVSHDGRFPQYIRAGVWTVNVEVDTWDDYMDDSEWDEREDLDMVLGKKKITVNYGTGTNWGFSYGGQTATGAHNYTFTAHASDASDNFNSNDEILKIESTN